MTIAAALQSAAKVGSILVGPATRAATEGIFSWGSTEDVQFDPKAKPIAAVYLDRPKARRSHPPDQGSPRLRARLVGRDHEVWELGKALREATAGNGSAVFIVGEPGLGKTRLVQECRNRFMGWVGAGTGRLPLWLEGHCASYAGSTPYGLYQQLLSAWTGVAPEEGEGAVASALARATRAVFGTATPHHAFLAHMMGVRPDPASAEVAEMAPEGLQRAIFAAVSALVSRLAERGPTVLALEDLHWADPTSLRLTAALAAVARDAPLLLIATWRPEPDPGVSALEADLETSPGCRLRRVELSPLSHEAERHLAQSILGHDAPGDAVAAVRANVEGNPLFLEERFSSLVETGALVRRGSSWWLDTAAVGEIPGALERMTRARVDRLASLPRDTIIAASVLGAEFPISALEALSVGEQQMTAGVAELCQAGLLTEVRRMPEPAYRFRHTLIQEAIYQGLLRTQRRQLHARVAWGLESASSQRLEELAAILGHHFALAEETERAVHYLAMAGAHAASHFANDEAVASYRRALQIVDRNDGRQSMANEATELRRKLAEVFWRCSRFEEARETLQSALGLVDLQQPLQAAQLLTRLGRVEVEDYNYNAAMAAFDAADELLGENPEDRDQEWVDLWLEVQVDGRANLHYWYSEPERGLAVLSRARPIVEARGSLTSKTAFWVQFAIQRARETRYRIDDEILAILRHALSLARQGVGQHDLAAAIATLGEFLVWSGDLDEAEGTLKAALAIGERIGDPFRRSDCLCHLNHVAFRRHDIEAVRCLSSQALDAAIKGNYPMYIASALAGSAWVAWKDARPDDVVALASEALALWGSLSVTYHFKGFCLWPLVSVHLSAGRIAEAVDVGCRILEPPQIRLPDELESVVKVAKWAWNAGEAELAARELEKSVELASRFRYA